MSSSGGEPRAASAAGPAPAVAGAAAATPATDALAGSLGRRFAPDEARCEFCGHPALDRHCKVVCVKCGAVRDCSDP